MEYLSFISFLVLIIEIVRSLILAQNLNPHKNS